MSGDPKRVERPLPVYVLPQGRIHRLEIRELLTRDPPDLDTREVHARPADPNVLEDVELQDRVICGLAKLVPVNHPVHVVHL